MVPSVESMDSCFGFVRSHQHGIADNAKVSFCKQSILHANACHRQQSTSLIPVTIYLPVRIFLSCWPSPRRDICCTMVCLPLLQKIELTKVCRSGHNKDDYDATSCPWLQEHVPRRRSTINKKKYRCTDEVTTIIV